MINKRRPSTNTVLLSSDTATTTAQSNPKCHSVRQHKMSLHLQPKSQPKTRQSTIAPLLETINSLAINSDNSSDEDSSGGEVISNKNGNRNSRQCRSRGSHNNRSGQTKFFSNCQRESLGDIVNENNENNEDRDNKGNNFEVNRNDREDVGERHKNQPEQIGNDIVEQSSPRVREEVDDDEDNQYFSEDYDFNANTSDEPLPLPAMLRMARNSAQQQQHNGTNGEEQRELFHTEETTISLQNNVLDSHQNSKNHHNPHNRYHLDSGTSGRNYRQSSNKAVPTTPITVPASGATTNTKCVRFNCDVQVTSVSPRMTPKFATNSTNVNVNINGNSGSTIGNHGNLGNYGSDNDSTIETGSNTYDEVASLSNQPITQQQLSPSHNNNNAPHSGLPVQSVEQSQSTGKHYLGPNNKKCKRKILKKLPTSHIPGPVPPGIAAAGVGNCSLSASSSATSISDSEYGPQQGPQHPQQGPHLYVNFEMINDQQSKDPSQQQTQHHQPSNIVSPINLLQQQQQQKSILKDPLCAKLRSAIRRGQFSMAETTKLESEIDSLLYGNELQQQQSMVMSMSSQKEVDETLRENGVNNPKDHHEDQEDVQGTLSLTTTNTTNNNIQQASSLMIPFHHHVNHLHNRLNLNSNPNQQRDVSGGNFLTKPNEHISGGILEDNKNYPKLLSQNNNKKMLELKELFRFDKNNSGPAVPGTGGAQLSYQQRHLSSSFKQQQPVVDIAAAAIQHCNSYIQMIEEKYRHKGQPDLNSSSNATPTGSQQTQQPLTTPTSNPHHHQHQSKLAGSQQHMNGSTSKGSVKSHKLGPAHSHQTTTTTWRLPHSMMVPNSTVPAHHHNHLNGSGTNPSGKYAHFLPPFTTGIDQLMSNLFQESQRGPPSLAREPDLLGSKPDLVISAIGGGGGYHHNHHHHNAGSPMVQQNPTPKKRPNSNPPSTSITTANDKLYSMFADPVKGPSINILMDELSRSFHNVQTAVGSQLLSDSESIQSDSNQSKSLAENHIYEEILYECLEQQQQQQLDQLGPNNQHNQLVNIPSTAPAPAPAVVNNTFAQQPLETIVTISNHRLI